MVSTAAFHARVRCSVPGLGGFEETEMFLPHPRVKVSIVGSLRDREVACSASDRQGSNFESCVWRTVSSQSSHHPQEVQNNDFTAPLFTLFLISLFDWAFRVQNNYTTRTCAVDKKFYTELTLVPRATLRGSVRPQWRMCD